MCWFLCFILNNININSNLKIKTLVIILFFLFFIQLLNILDLSNFFIININFWRCIETRSSKLRASSHRKNLSLFKLNTWRIKLSFIAHRISSACQNGRIGHFKLSLFIMKYFFFLNRQQLGSLGRLYWRVEWFYLISLTVLFM